MQQFTSLSTTEAEYVSFCIATQEAIWLDNILQGINNNFDCKPILYADNKGAISFAKNNVMHGTLKHTDIRYHFVRQKLQQETTIIKFLRSKDMLADHLTKNVPRNSLKRQLQGIKNMTLESLNKWQCYKC